MSDCCCNNDQTVRLIEYTLISVQRCKEKILKKGELIDTGDLGDSGIAAWVVAEYVQKKGGSLSEEEMRNLRVYHHVLDSWPRQEKDCCDGQTKVLGEINETLQDIAKHWRSQQQEASATA